jgi:hypothetical protein
MPELIILISAIACVGSAVFVYYNRSSAAATGIAVISFIAFLYGIGQFVERDNIEAKSLGFADAADRRAAKVAGVDDGGRRKRYNGEAEVRDKTKKPEEPVVARRQADVIPDDPAKHIQLPPPTELSALGAPAPTVFIANFTSQKSATNYLEVSGTVVNTNEFSIKNIVVKCGDKSFAAGDVSALVDKVMPAKSELKVAGVRMGPINPHLPPTTCLIAKFDRAN